MYSAYKLNKQDDNIQLLHTPFLIWNQCVVPCPVLTVVSWPAYRFLRRHLLKNFPQFVVIHTAKGSGVANKAEADVFLEPSCFFNDSVGVDNLISGSSAFLNAAWKSGSLWFTYCWSLAWRIFSIILLVSEMSAIVWQFAHSLALPFFGIRMKTDIFQSCGHYWVLHICWHTKCSTFTESSLKIWNSSTEIPSPPLALFIVMLSKAHLTSHSRMYGSRWVWS